MVTTQQQLTNNSHNTNASIKCVGTGWTRDQTSFTLLIRLDDQDAQFSFQQSAAP